MTDQSVALERPSQADLFRLNLRRSGKEEEIRPLHAQAPIPGIHEPIDLLGVSSKVIGQG